MTITLRGWLCVSTRHVFLFSTDKPYRLTNMWMAENYDVIAASCIPEPYQSMSFEDSPVKVSFEFDLNFNKVKKL